MEHLCVICIVCSVVLAKNNVVTTKN